jgi:hypothetical protein
MKLIIIIIIINALITTAPIMKSFDDDILQLELTAFWNLSAIDSSTQ